MSVATLHTPARKSQVSPDGGLRFAEETLPADGEPIRLDRDADGTGTLVHDPDRTSPAEVVEVLHGMQYRDEVTGSASRLRRLHERALLRAVSYPGPGHVSVRQMQVEDVHRAALVEAEAEVDGRTPADQAVEVAVGMIRQAITGASDPAAVAERLMRVIGVTAEFMGADVAQGNGSVTVGRSSEDDHRAAGAEHGEGQQ